MNQSTLYRIIAAALVVLAIVLINVLKDSPMIRIVAILVCSLLASVPRQENRNHSGAAVPATSFLTGGLFYGKKSV